MSSWEARGAPPWTGEMNGGEDNERDERSSTRKDGTDGPAQGASLSSGVEAADVELVSDPRAVSVGRGVLAAHRRSGGPLCPGRVEIGFLGGWAGGRRPLLPRLSGYKQAGGHKAHPYWEEECFARRRFGSVYWW